MSDTDSNNFSFTSSTSSTYSVCDWLKDAKIYNHKYTKVLNTAIMDRVDSIVLYFSMLNADRHDIISKFCEIYRNTRGIRLPVEVINVPMDENKSDMWKSYEKQPNWYTLKYGDPLIPMLQYRYGITSVPHLLVMQPDGTIVSSHGILDLDTYGMNALIAWLCSPSTNPHRLTKELGSLDVSICNVREYQYARKFSIAPTESFSESSKSWD